MRQELKFFMWLSVLKLDLYSKYKKDTYSKGEIQRYSRMALGGLSIRWISRPAPPCWPLNPNMTWATFWFSLRRCAGLMEKIYGREGCCPEPLSHQVSWVVSFVHYNPSFVADSVGLMHWHVFRANDQQNFVFQDYREQGQFYLKNNMSRLRMTHSKNVSARIPCSHLWMTQASPCRLSVCV